MTSQAESPPARHIAGLDLIRFAAAMMVMLYHLALVAWAQPTTSLQVLGLEPFLSPIWPLTWFGFVGVEIFFVISGFVIAFSAEKASPFTFFRERLVRLAPAVWLTAVISLGVFLAFDLAAASQALRMFLAEVLFWPPSAKLDIVVWTLYIEISFYFLVFCLLCIRRFRWITGLAATLAVAGFAYQSLSYGFGCWSWSAGGVCRILNGAPLLTSLALLEHGPFFALGIFLWAWLVKGAARLGWWWVGLAVCAGLLQIAEATQYNIESSWFGDVDAPLLPALMVTAGVWAAGLLALAASIRWNHRLAALLGEQGARVARLLGLATYPLYLIHHSWGPPLIWLARKAVPLPVAIALGMMAVIALSLLIARFVEPRLQRGLRGAIDATGDFARARSGRLAFLFVADAGGGSKTL